MTATSLTRAKRKSVPSKDSAHQGVPVVPQGLTPGETPQEVFERAMKALERGRKKYRNALKAMAE